MRSRAVRRDLACWLSMAFAPPPSRIFSSSLRTWATRSARARMLDSKRRELGSSFVGRTLLMESAVDSVRSRMRADFEITCETTYYTSARKRLALTLQSENVWEAQIPSRLADCAGNGRGVARLLFSGGCGVLAVPASGSGRHSQQRTRRESADAVRSSLCVAWNLGAVRHALVFADCYAWIRSADGGDLLSIVSGGASAGE